MMHSLCLHVRGMRGFFGWEHADMDSFSAYANLRPPLARKLVPRHAKQSRTAVLVSSAAVLLVAFCRYVAQVLNAVIKAVAIDVVNLKFRPFAVAVKPCESIGAVQIPADTDVTVSLLVDVPGNVPDFDVSARHLPSEMPGGFVVRQERLEGVYVHAGLYTNRKRNGVPIK